MAGPQQQNCRQRDPAAHRMHHHRAGKVVELRPEALGEPGLDAECLVPGDALEEGIDEADDEKRGRQLRIEPRSAMPPETIAGIAAANVSRKKNRVSSKPLFSSSDSALVKK